jgi:hypothetical protein
MSAEIGPMCRVSPGTLDTWDLFWRSPGDLIEEVGELSLGRFKTISIFPFWLLISESRLISVTHQLGKHLRSLTISSPDKEVGRQQPELLDG